MKKILQVRKKGKVRKGVIPIKLSLNSSIKSDNVKSVNSSIEMDIFFLFSLRN